MKVSDRETGLPSRPTTGERESAIEVGVDSQGSGPAGGQIRLRSFRILFPGDVAAIGSEAELRGANGEVVHLHADGAGELQAAEDLFDGSWELKVTHGSEWSSGKVTSRSLLGQRQDPAEIRLYALVELEIVVTGAAQGRCDVRTVEVGPTGQSIGRGTPETRTLEAGAEAGKYLAKLECDAGAYRVRATLSDGSECSTTFTADQERAGDERQQVQLPCCEQVVGKGVVSDPVGAPVAGAVVHVMRYRGPRNPDRRSKRERLETSLHGEFELDPAWGDDVVLIAEHPDWCASNPFLLAEQDELDRNNPRLSLVQPTSVAGRVVNGHGEGVEGALVVALRDEAASPELDYVAGTDLGILYGMSQVSSAANGHFELPNVRPGEGLYQVLCMPDTSRRDRVTGLSGVHAGRQDLLIELDEEALAGGSLELICGGNGAQPIDCAGRAVFFFEKGDDGVWIQHAMRSMPASGAFYREGLEFGRDYAAVVMPVSGYLPSLIGPWTCEGAWSVQPEFVKPTQVLLQVPVGPSGVYPAKVELVPLHGHPYESEGWTLSVDGDGVVRSPLRPGTYSAEYSLNGAKHVEELIVPTSDGEQSLALVGQ